MRGAGSLRFKRLTPDPHGELRVPRLAARLSIGGHPLRGACPPQKVRPLRSRPAGSGSLASWPAWRTIRQILFFGLPRGVLSVVPQLREARVMPPLVARHERALVLALAIFAGLRVLCFALAFPFFTNVDEYRHVDAVLKYARGQLPQAGPVPYEPEMARLLGVVGSPEYHRDPVAPLRPELPPPAWQSSRKEVASRVARMEAYLKSRHSLEAGQAPVYYAAAGAWLVVGRAFGLRDAALLYWVRLLPALAAAALVFACWAVLRVLYAERPFVFWGVALLVAVMPQDAAYYVTGDALSPLLGGVAFLLTVRLLAHPSAENGAYFAAGVALAAALLAKYPNAALYASSGVVSVVLARRGAAPRRLALLWAAALAPALVWFGRNAWLGAGLTGTAFKVERLGWTPKPLSDWLDHPVFSPAGAWVFSRDLVTSFWRGELVWQQRLLASAAADALYRVVSFGGLAFAAVGMLRGRGSGTARAAEAAAAAAVVAAVGLLGLLSLAFVFDATVHPSPAYPYFSNGRLVGGVLVPLALLIVRGIEEATSWLPRRGEVAAWGALAALAAVAVVSELALTAPVFASAYNAYHLP